MARDTDALLITAKWAGAGDVATPQSQGLALAVGWPSSYSTSGGDTPEREVFNWLFRVITALAVEINTHGGILEWDDGITYVHPAFVVGSDDSLYASVQGSLNQDPTTDTSDTYWTLFAGVVDATTTVKGVVELATDAESRSGQLANRAVTPSGLGSRTPNASTGARGLVELATNAESTTGTDTGRAVTPRGMAERTPNASSGARGLIEIATESETRSQSSTSRAVPPAFLDQANVDRVDGRHIWTGTEAAYAAITTKDVNTVYLRT